MEESYPCAPPAVVFAVVFALLTGVATPAAAQAPARAAQTARAPWATVNVCDTAARPDTIGVRGWMPALRRRTAMFMRFGVQYLDRQGRWRTVRTGSADSGWVRAGAGRRALDAGWSFRFQPPSGGGRFRLRGRVVFEWRRGGRVIRRARALTAAGHPGTEGADPAGYSAEECRIA